MKLYTKPLLITAAVLSMVGCSKSDTDGRFSDTPQSRIDTPNKATLSTAQELKWQFTNTDEWLNASQGENADVSQTFVESNSEAEDGKVIKIYTEANTQQRKKLKSKKQYGAGLYTWRTYISDLGVTERVSIGSWLWNSDKHELDFEVGSGTAKERETLAAADDEVIAYITSQDNPFVQQKVKIKKNAWHTFKIDLQLVGDKYFATWLIDEVKCAAQQLNYGQEHPFHIFCSTENLKFIGDNWPYQDHYGLWDYVSYTPYPYAITPVEPTTQVNPIDETPEPDKGEVKRWTFNTFPHDWIASTNIGSDGVGYNKIQNGKLVLSVDNYCGDAKIRYKNAVGYGKYTWSVKLPQLTGITEATNFQIGGTLYTTNEDNGAHCLTMMAWYGNESDRTRLGAKAGQYLLRLYSEIPGYEAYVAVLDPDKEYKFTIELKKAADKYVIVYYLDGRPLKSLQASYGAELVKFDFIISAEANKGWMKKKPLSSRLDASFNFIEYTAY